MTLEVAERSAVWLEASTVCAEHDYNEALVGITMNYIAVLFIGLLLGSTAPLLSAGELPDTVRQVKRSIVGIGTILLTGRPPVGLSATGFVVGDGRHVITNAHSLAPKSKQKKSEYLAVLTNARTSGARRATVVKVDTVHDLALLRFDGAALPALRIGNSKQVREGELYAFTGFPIGIVLGFFPVTHRGIVSAITPIAIPQISSRSLTAAVVKRLHNRY